MSTSASDTVTAFDNTVAEKLGHIACCRDIATTAIQRISTRNRQALASFVARNGTRVALGLAHIWAACAIQTQITANAILAVYAASNVFGFAQRTANLLRDTAAIASATESAETLAAATVQSSSTVAVDGALRDGIGRFFLFFFFALLPPLSPAIVPCVRGIETNATQ